MKIEFNLLHKSVLTRVSLALALAGALLLQQEVTANSTGVDFGPASWFAALTGSGVPAAGHTEGAGTGPGSATTDVAKAAPSDVNSGGDAITARAGDASAIASDEAAGRAFETGNGDASAVAGLTLFSAASNDSTLLSRSGRGSPGAAGGGQAGAPRSAAAGSQVDLIAGAQAGNVVGPAGGSATPDTDFDGGVMALASIALNTGATVDGRVLAPDGAAALDNSLIAQAIVGDVTLAKVPDSGCTLAILGVGLAALAAFGRKLDFSAALRAG